MPSTMCTSCKSGIGVQLQQAQLQKQIKVSEPVDLGAAWQSERGQYEYREVFARFLVTRL